MNLHKLTILAGAALVLSAPVLSKSPAIALPSGETAAEQLMAQEFRSSQTINGRIRCITGDIVAVKLDSGDFKMIALSRQEMGALGLVSGMRVSATLQDERLVAIDREVIQVQTVASSNLLQRVRQLRTEIESRSATQRQVIQQPARIPRQQFTPPPARQPVAPPTPIRGLW